MRKLLKVALLISLIGAVLLAAAAGTLIVTGPPTFDEPQPEFDASQGVELRGKRAASMMCFRCHYDPSTGAFSGRSLWPEYKAYGRAYARNITKDEVLGIGEWTDAELAVYLRTGVHPHTNELSPPYMPHSPNIADSDLADLIVFLRSDHPWVAPARVKDRPSEPSARATLEAWLRWEPGPAEREPVERPSEGEPLALGKYLATDLLGCHGCHSENLGTTNWNDPDDTSGLFKGGAALTDVGGHAIYGSNLTPSVEAGIGAWSFEDFARALTEGLDPDGKMLAWPMPRYPELTVSELQAMYAYLSSLPASDREEPRNYEYRLVPDVIDPGRRAYYEQGCQYCHPDDGGGLMSLSEVPKRYEDDAALAAFIAKPTGSGEVEADGTVSKHLMPAYGDLIDETRLLQLAEYVRRRVERHPDALPPSNF